MAFEVVMPRLGWNIEAGSLVEWRKQDGEQVTAGEILFTVESDKAIQEVEALESGMLRIPPDSPLPGVQVPVGTRLAYLLQPGEPLPFHPGQTAQPFPALAAAPSSAAPALVPAPRPMIAARSASTAATASFARPCSRAELVMSGPDADSVRSSLVWAVASLPVSIPIASTRAAAAIERACSRSRASSDRSVSTRRPPATRRARRA